MIMTISAGVFPALFFRVQYVQGFFASDIFTRFFEIILEVAHY